MPICITCSTPVPSLYTTYSKADDRSLGKGVRLTQCPKCKRFADKYVEHDFVVLFIDLVLIKPQVYRHLLFNRLSSSSRSPHQFDPSIIRLGILLILFDVYLTWARIESSTATSALNDTPILTQYIFFLTLNILATAAQHFTIRLLVKFFMNGATSDFHPSPGGSTGSNGNSSPDKETLAGSASPPPQSSLILPMAIPGRATPAAISTALLVSSCTKLFPILLVIWPTSTPSDDNGNPAEAQSSNVTFASRATGYVGWAVLVNNIEALLILLDCGYVVATGLAVAGALARYMVEITILGMVGLSEDTPGGVGSVVGKIGSILGVG